MQCYEVQNQNILKMKVSISVIIGLSNNSRFMTRVKWLSELKVTPMVIITALRQTDVNREEMSQHTSLPDDGDFDNHQSIVFSQ